MKRKKMMKREYVKFFSEFAVHLWLILLFGSVLLVYTFNFYLRAAGSETSSLESSRLAEGQAEVPTLIPEPTEVVPAEPGGPLLGLSFSISGIGSGGGNMKPIHPTRSATIYLYAQGVNAQDKNVRPISAIKTKAHYDTNKNSPTYTSFVSAKIDLGTGVSDGDYQIVIKSNQSFRTLIKEKPEDVGGKIFALEKGSSKDEYPTLPHQTLFAGDIVPQDGNNTVELGDYFLLVKCYKLKRGTPECPNPFFADLNDDGIVDGIDYNIMILSFKELKEQGYSIPELVITPTSSKVSQLSHLTGQPKKSTQKPAAAPKKEVKQSGGGGTFLTFFLGFLAAGGFVLFLKRKSIIALVQSFSHPSPGSAPTTATTPQQGADQAEQAPSAATTQAEPSQAAPVQDQPAAAGSTATPSAGSPQSSSGQAGQGPSAGSGQAKEYFVKKQSADDAKTGFWLTLTDENGPMLGHYKGADVTDGFAQIKGEMKTEKGKKFMEITELTPET